MGADPSIDWNSVSAGFDESVNSMQKGVDEADANKQYWANQNVLWAAMYGNLEKNVASYYDSLTPDNVTSELNNSTIAKITAEKDRTLQSLQDRGFTNSGMVAQVIANSGTNQAIALAHNAYEANNKIWQQKTAFMQGIAMPEKQMNERGLDSASKTLGNAYGNLANAQNTRANARMQIEQFNEAHKHDQLNAGIGAVTSIAGAAMGGGMFSGGYKPQSYGQYQAPKAVSAPVATPQPIQFDMIDDGTRVV